MFGVLYCLQWSEVCNGQEVEFSYFAPPFHTARAWENERGTARGLANVVVAMLAACRRTAEAPVGVFYCLDVRYRVRLSYQVMAVRGFRSRLFF